MGELACRDTKLYQNYSKNHILLTPGAFIQIKNLEDQKLSHREKIDWIYNIPIIDNPLQIKSSILELSLFGYKISNEINFGMPNVGRKLILKFQFYYIRVCRRAVSRDPGKTTKSTQCGIIMFLLVY